VLGTTAGRDQWLEARRAMVCGSDIAALFGESRYGDATTVWADKTARTAPEPATSAQRRGQIFEDAIVKLWAERFADFPIETRRQGLMRSRRWVHAGATVDRLSICAYDGAAHRCLVEVKSQADMREWQGEEVPVPYVLQGLWQLIVTGREHVHYVALGPRFIPEHRIVHRDPGLEAVMLETAQAFWRDHIDADVAPAPTERAADTVKRLTIGNPGQQLTMDEEFAEVVRRAQERSAALDKAKREYDAALAAVQLRMGEATELLWDDGEPAATWNPGKTIDGCNADFRRAYPELVQAYTVPGPDVVDVAKLAENHPELLEQRLLRRRRTFTWKG
jgi:predicted phage-related endonuclease